MLAAVFLALATLPFQPVAADTTTQPPYVYVRDGSAVAETTDAGPLHDIGLRPPRASDPPGTPLFAGNGATLPFAYGVWNTAIGDATIDTVPAGTRVHAHFRGLLPGGMYSLFLRQTAVRNAVFIPLDGTGDHDSFHADGVGTGDALITYPAQIASGAQIVLLYHSDGVDHASSIGDPYRNVHAQLIVRVP